jgi:preprotein translocase subunit SecE
MAKKPGSRPQAIKARAAKTAAAITPNSPLATSAPAPAAAKPRPDPVRFYNQVRAEMRKITWTSRKETWITSVMVFIMVVMAAAFFWLVDTGMGFAMTQFLKFSAPGT